MNDRIIDMNWFIIIKRVEKSHIDCISTSDIINSNNDILIERFKIIWRIWLIWLILLRRMTLYIIINDIINKCLQIRSIKWHVVDHVNLVDDVELTLILFLLILLLILILLIRRLLILWQFRLYWLTMYNFFCRDVERVDNNFDIKNRSQNELENDETIWLSNRRDAKCKYKCKRKSYCCRLTTSDERIVDVVTKSSD